MSRGPNIIDGVRISKAVQAAWRAVSIAACEWAIAARIMPSEIPDEAMELRGGVLVIYVDLPGGRSVEVAVPDGHWSWVGRGGEEN